MKNELLNELVLPVKNQNTVIIIRKDILHLYNISFSLFLNP